MSLENANIMNVTKCDQSIVIIASFSDQFSHKRYTDKENAKACEWDAFHWVEKIEMTTKSRIPPWPPKQHGSQLAAVYCYEITGGEIRAHLSPT